MTSSNSIDCYLHIGSYLARDRPKGECRKKEKLVAIGHAEDEVSEPLVRENTLQLSYPWRSHERNTQLLDAIGKAEEASRCWR